MLRPAEVSQRLRELERPMDLFFDHPRIEEPPLIPRTADTVPDVRAPHDRGDKMGAISLLVQRTGIGMGEAKRTVDQMVGGS